MHISRGEVGGGGGGEKGERTCTYVCLGETDGEEKGGIG